MHRVSDPTSKPERNKPVVFMLHGLADSSEGFVINDDDSLAFGFAVLGYDVWLGNNRGGLYGKKHIAWDPYSRSPEEQGKFFDYSFYEMGKHDLPAMIGYTLDKTNQETLSFIGHS